MSIKTQAIVKKIWKIPLGNALSSPVYLLTSARQYCSLQTQYGISYRDSLDVCSVGQQLSYGTLRFEPPRGKTNNVVSEQV